MERDVCHTKMEVQAALQGTRQLTLVKHNSMKRRTSRADAVAAVGLQGNFWVKSAQHFTASF